MLIPLTFLLVLTIIITYLLVIVDMGEKNSAVLGCAGLLLFPITYYWALFKYSGRRKVVAPLLWGSTLLLIGVAYLAANEVNRDLEGFFEDSRSELGISCQFTNTLTWSANGRLVWVACRPPSTERVEFRNTSELVESYRNEYGSKLASAYGRHATNDDRLILMIPAPGNLYACYEVDPSGEISDSWFTGPEEPCKRRFGRRPGDEDGPQP